MQTSRFCAHSVDLLSFTGKIYNISKNERYTKNERSNQAKIQQKLIRLIDKLLHLKNKYF